MCESIVDEFLKCAMWKRYGQVTMTGCGPCIWVVQENLTQIFTSSINRLVEECFEVFSCPSEAGHCQLLQVTMRDVHWRCCVWTDACRGLWAAIQSRNVSEGVIDASEHVRRQSGGVASTVRAPPADCQWQSVKVRWTYRQQTECAPSSDDSAAGRSDERSPSALAVFLAGFSSGEVPALSSAGWEDDQSGLGRQEEHDLRARWLLLSALHLPVACDVVQLLCHCYRHHCSSQLRIYAVAGETRLDGFFVVRTAQPK